MDKRKKRQGHNYGQQKAKKKQMIETAKSKLLRRQKSAERTRECRNRTSIKLTAARYVIYCRIDVGVFRTVRKYQKE
jgi:hypothetical protein